MLESQRFQNLEAIEERIARFDRAIEYWRRQSYAYVTCTVLGMAQPHLPGQLAALLRALPSHPGALLLELASPTFRDDFMHWALTSRPHTPQAKDQN